ncbi:MAG: hypothetical protein AAFR61_15540 [Bacteroidota bacterium]
MKQLILSLLICFPLTQMACTSAEATGLIGPPYEEFATGDEVLKGIQQRIYQAFVASTISGDHAQLTALEAQLKDLHKESGQKLIVYWQSYLKFYSSIFYLKKSDQKTAEAEIDLGVKWMKNMKEKNAEDYALLAWLQGFSLQFKGMKVMFMASGIKENARKAVELDPENPRANFVYASNDYHTPEAYGGGKEAEKHLLKAISLPDQKVKNAYLPSWGREEAYEMLIKLYMKQEKWEEAKQHFAAGKKAFPESYQLNQLASQLIGK